MPTLDSRNAAEYTYNKIILRRVCVRVGVCACYCHNNKTRCNYFVL